MKYNSELQSLSGSCVQVLFRNHISAIVEGSPDRASEKKIVLSVPMFYSSKYL